MPVPSAYTKRHIGGGFIAGGNSLSASLTTALTGSNNDLVYTARSKGASGNAIRVRYVVAGNNTALSVSVSGTDITVNSATNGSAAATSTAAQVAAAVAAYLPSNKLVVVSNAAGNDGSGAVIALAFTALSGGTDWTIGTRL